MQRNILITGGAGFIGKQLIKQLLMSEPDSHIWVLDNLHTQVHGNDARPPNFPDSVTFVKADIADKVAVHTTISNCQPELVVHLAAETGTGQSYDELSRYNDVNVMGTAHLVEGIRAYSKTTKKIVLASSRAVYGEGAYCDQSGRVHTGLARQADRMKSGDFTVQISNDTHLPVLPYPSNTDLSPAPASIYASTKLMQEYILKQAGEGASWNATILRFQNVYGPGQSLKNPYTGVLSIFSQQILQGKSLAIYEDGKIARDFVFVDDVANALRITAQKDLPHAVTIDIGQGKASTILDVAQSLMKNLGYSGDNYKITGQFRVGDIRHACADIRKANELLDWQPRVDIETGLALLADWAKSEVELR